MDREVTPLVVQQTLGDNAIGNHSGKSQLVVTILTLLQQVLVRWLLVRDSRVTF